MNASRPQANDRTVQHVLLACVLFGLIVFMALKMIQKPAPTVVDPAVVAPATTREDPRAPDPSARDVAPSVDGKTAAPALTDAPPRPRDGKAALVHGRVRGRRSGPVAQAAVSLALVRGSSEQHLGDVTTDGRGEFDFSHPVLAAAFGTESRLRVSADVGGFQPGTGFYLLSALSKEFGVEVDLLLDSGARVSGRVVRPGHDMMQGGEVTLLVAHQAGDVKSFVRVTSTPCGQDGKFTLGFASGGEYRITARAEGVGTGVVEKLELEAGHDRVLEDIALAGGPPILGRITAVGGEPVPFLELWAIDGNYANETDALARAALRVAADERGDGLVLTKTWTDDAGKFALAGLRPGHYALRSPDRSVVLEPRQLRYEPGAKDVELVLSSQRLIVRVFESDAVPANNAIVRVTDLATDAAGNYQASSTRTVPVDVRKGVACFTVDPEAPIAVQAFDSRRSSPEEIVILAQNEWTRRMVLTLSDLKGSGRVRFDVIGEDGLPLTALRIAALSSVTRIARDELGALETDANGVLPALPSGSYHFVIGYAPGTDRDHFVVRTTDPVVVRAPDETIVSLRAHRGARPEVTLELHGDPPQGFAESGNLDLDARRDRFGVRVTFTPAAGGTASSPQFRSPTGVGVVAAILPGETLVADGLLEPGAYDVGIESTAFALGKPARVVLVAGAANGVTVSVIAR